MLISIGDVVDGALVNAIALTGGRVSAAIQGYRGRRRAEDLSVARWFGTYRLTSEVADLPELSPALTQRLADLLRGDEIQAALQELLAARLTGAPETDAAQRTAGTEPDAVPPQAPVPAWPAMPWPAITTTRSAPSWPGSKPMIPRCSPRSAATPSPPA